MQTLSSPEKLSLLFELSQAFGALIELGELLPLVNARTKQVLDAESCAILLLDDERQELYFPVTSDSSREVEERLHSIRVPVGSGVAGWVVREGRAALVPYASRDPRFNPEVDRQSGAQTRDLLYAPLRTRNGVIGAIGLRNKQSGGFTEEDLAFLDALAGQVAVAIDNARLYERLQASEGRLRTEVGALRRDIARRDRFTEIVGSGPAMADVFRLMESAASSSIAVLVEGETGTGKELVARGIHRESARSEGPFLALNCAAVPETLLESELFGYRRGAFTGALQDKRGLFEAASGGTILLDEVGEMPASMQAKLLRVLQESEVVPVGDTRPRKIDVRVISATNRDLAAEVAAHRFREDLYYRLSAFPIRLPPLRDRREDIPLIVGRILAAFSERQRKRIGATEPAAMELLAAYGWPGNVRELEDEIERAMVLARDGGSIAPGHLSAKLREPASTKGPSAGAALAVGADATGAGDLRSARAAVEARFIAEALETHAGNVTRTARALDMSRVTLYKKMRALGLPRT